MRAHASSGAYGVRGAGHNYGMAIAARMSLPLDGVTVVTEPFDGPFGRTFAFADPDGYVVTVHG